MGRPSGMKPPLENKSGLGGQVFGEYNRIMAQTEAVPAAQTILQVGERLQSNEVIDALDSTEIAFAENLDLAEPHKEEQITQFGSILVEQELAAQGIAKDNPQYEDLKQLYTEIFKESSALYPTVQSYLDVGISLEVLKNYHKACLAVDAQNKAEKQRYKEDSSLGDFKPEAYPNAQEFDVETDKIDKFNQLIQQEKSAIQDASEAGIRHATDIYRVLRGDTQATPEQLTDELMGMIDDLSVHHLIQFVITEIGAFTGVSMDESAIDTQLVKVTIEKMLPGSWMSPEEQSFVQAMFNKTSSKRLTDDALVALKAVGSAVHLSWASIQLSRTASFSQFGQGELLAEYVFAAADEQNNKPEPNAAAIQANDRLTNKEPHNGLRIFGNNMATLPAMVVSMYAQYYETNITQLKEQNVRDAERKAASIAIGAAVLEFIKDLIKVRPQ